MTRPRRFGKTVIASMIAAFFGRGQDNGPLFDGMAVAGCGRYKAHRNRHHVIHIMMNEAPDGCRAYEQYITRIRGRLRKDLDTVFPGMAADGEESLWDYLNSIYEATGERFLFVLDEWDYIYHQPWVSERDKADYTRFLSMLFKDQPYVELAFMTGILPIAKYSSGSELNMFCEYTMVSEERFSAFYGFTEEEVDGLYERYLSQNFEEHRVSREGLRLWYNGYHTKGGIRVYNPRSVVLALTNNNLGDYWTNSGPYDELFYYIGANVNDVRDDVGLMLADMPVPARIQEYAAASAQLRTRDEIFSAMVVYGFLNYENGCVSIPNRELMGKFSDMAQKEPSMGNVYRLARQSARMLQATKDGDTALMEELLTYAHNTESPLNVYHRESELALLIKWIYLSALDSYRIEREDKAGTGYADFIFYPYRADDDGIIIELKVDSTPEQAVRQILEKGYPLRFEGRPGERPLYTGRILAVGISYNRQDQTRRHRCAVEVVRDRR